MRFSIRDLLLVTVIVALAVGWILERIRAERLALRVHEAAQEADSMEAASEVMLRHWAKLEEENMQIRMTLAELPHPSAPAPIPPKP